MALGAGTRLGPYEIVEPIGSGGMGDVYRARDTRLGRDVAIKVLPTAMAHDPERQARFEREARAIASLNHPHICAIYDVGRQPASGEPIEFLVMEFLEGETLAARLARGGSRASGSGRPAATPALRPMSTAPSAGAADGALPQTPRGRSLPLAETLRIAAELAEALAAAHRAGIVHRDLKPANVMLTSSGVKVLDFGLAKLHEQSHAARVDYATVTAPLTDVGVVMGTMPYMAPEQIEGREVDQRADLFAFGAILHEMVTGERAFTANSQAGLIAALLDQQPPPISAIVPTAPRSLERVVQRCLEKEPNNRWQSALDLAAELKWIGQTLQSDTTAAAISSRAARPRSWLAAAGVLIAALVAGSLFAIDRLARRDSTGPSSSIPIHSRIRLADGVSLAGWGSPVIELSPDGRLLAVVGMKNGSPRLFVHRLDRDETTEVPDSSEAEGPFFSPDGQWIGFAVGVSSRSGIKGELKKYSLATGLTQSMTEIPDFFGGAWREDGTVFFMGANGAQLQKVRAEGGRHESALAAIRSTGRTVANYGYSPQLLPDGRLLQIVETDDGEPRPAILNLESGEMTVLDMVTPFARYLSSGHLFYMRLDGTMMAVPFDAQRGRAIGAEIAVISGISVVGNWEPAVAVSKNGVLAYSTGPITGSTWTSSNLVRIMNGVATPLGFEPEYFRLFRVSSDGNFIAASTSDGSLWIYDMRRKSRTKLPDGGVRYRDWPSWSPDNSRLAFISAVVGWHLFVQPVDGVSPPQAIVRGPEEKAAGAFTPDGQSYVFMQHKGRTTPGFNLWRVRLAPDQQPERMTTTTAAESNPAFSPDGKWIAYAAADTGRFEVYLQPYPELSRRVQVSVSGSSSPRWSADSRTLYYGSGTTLFAVDISGAGATVTVGQPKEIMEIPGVRGAYPLFDGSFVALQNRTDVGTVNELKLIVNWFEELRRVAPARAD